MSTGKDPKTMAITPEYAEGFERTFGDRKPQRGRWVWDAAQNKLVSAEDYRPPEKAYHAPINMDRYYEGTRALDGADIGSRRKRNEYMKRNGLIDQNDCSQSWVAREREHTKREREKSIEKAVVEAVMRHDKP